MSRYKIILNPIAGKGYALKNRQKIEELFTQYQLDYDIVLTEFPEHATELARHAAHDGYDFVIAAGGDGTANEVLNGLMQARAEGLPVPVLGIIPVGRGNDFAFGVNIPANLDEACALIASLPRKWIDIGKITGGNQKEGLYFGNGVGIGFDAMVGFVAAKMKLSGMLSYLVAAIKTIFIYYKSPLIQITLDHESFTIPALLVSIMNGQRMGGGFMMVPSARPDDGIFGLNIVREVPQMAMFGLMVKIMKGTHVTDPAVVMTQSKKIRVTALKGSMPCHADGVTICEEGIDLTIEIIPRGLEIITRLDESC
ncbi:MAG: diacylglycerol kinase family lipid kinase [Anaerolineaceae bacterium]|nr:diacylglycerol kinase family lipid kinase [Anaerolineaceae bacterium]